MGLFSSRKKSPTAQSVDPDPLITDRDIADVNQLMVRWEGSVGNSEAMWDCLELIGRRSGYRGIEEAMREMMATGRTAAEVNGRPWRWLREVTRIGADHGEHDLVGRIFMFTWLFVNHVAPRMTVSDEVQTGLSNPQPDIYQEIATLAVRSLSRMDPTFMIQSNSTGQVDVAGALLLAEEVSGVSAPAGSTTIDPPNGRRPWNSL